jgi:hypothetical protein
MRVLRPAIQFAAHFQKIMCTWPESTFSWHSLTASSLQLCNGWGPCRRLSNSVVFSYNYHGAWHHCNARVRCQLAHTIGMQIGQGHKWGIGMVFCNFFAVQWRALPRWASGLYLTFSLQRSAWFVPLGCVLLLVLRSSHKFAAPLFIHVACTCACVCA